MFLALHFFWTSYGASLTVMAFINIIEAQNLFGAVYVDAHGKTFKADWFIVFNYLFDKEMAMVFGGLLYFACSIMLFFFCCYHLYLVWRGMTTAESRKFSEVEKFYNDRIQFLDWMKLDRKTVLEVMSEKDLLHYKIDYKKAADKKYIEERIAFSYKMLDEIQAVLEKRYARGFYRNISEIMFGPFIQ